MTRTRTRTRTSRPRRHRSPRSTAIAISMRDGAAAGLAALENLARALADYHLFYAARADMLARAGKDPRPDLRKALGLVTNDGERRLLERRLAAANSRAVRR
jgi:predicted RNA polymerase sigma factor